MEYTGYGGHHFDVKKLEALRMKNEEGYGHATVCDALQGSDVKVEENAIPASKTMFGRQMQSDTALHRRR